MSSKLRKTGQPVNKRAVETLWKNLHSLWTLDPMGFIELVRKSRKRKYRIFNDPHALHKLVQGGFCDARNGYCVHDSYRELINACVEGKGLHMVLHRPFMGDDKPVAKTVTLRNQLTVTPHLVDEVMIVLRGLLERHYVAFTELVRHVRDNKPSGKLIPHALDELIEMGTVEIVEYETPAGVLMVRFGQLPGSHPLMLLQQHQKLVVRDYIATILKITAIGNRGLDFGLRSPYQTETHVESNGQPTGEKEFARTNNEPG